MDKRDEPIDRLLRAAAACSAESEAAEAPFGFDTRVVAHWRAQRSERGADFWDFARVFRRVAASAAIVTACAGAGAVWQLQQNNDFDEPTTSAYAIADNAIEAGGWQQ